MEKKISSKLIYQGKILKLYVDGVELPDNSHSFREYIRHSGGAAVLLVADGKVALVKQYRYVYGREIYEIPAGKLEEGEDPAFAAQRECEEETGYRVSVKNFMRIYPTPGYTDEVIHVYLADNPKFVGQKCDEGEFLSCEFIPLDEVLKMVESGEICDAKTVAAIYKYIYEQSKTRS